ncbi:MAG: glycosyl transferase family 36 [bacterium]
MRRSELTTEERSALPVQIALYLTGACSVAATGVAVQLGNVVAAALLGALAAGITAFGLQGRRIAPAEALQDALVAAAFAASATPGLRVWEAPATWKGLFALTPPAAAAACFLYFLLAAHTSFSRGRHLSRIESLAALSAPFLFNCLLVLQAPSLLERTGRLLFRDTALSLEWVRWLGKGAVLFLVNEAAANALMLLMAGRLLCEARMHALLLASALFAVTTPALAQWGSGAAVASLHPLLGVPLAIAAAVGAQAGLWAQVFLLTGLFMDALHRKQPAWYWGGGHFRSGLLQGAVYGGFFMGLVHGAACLLSVPWVRALLATHPWESAFVAGILLFPLVKTVIESFEGSRPFVVRLRDSYRRWDHGLRGGLVGAAAAWALRQGLPAAGSGTRFLFGLAAGAAAYAAVNLLRDAIDCRLLGRRQRLQAPRVYAIEAMLGALAGGAVCWYFDAAQAQVVAAKFRKYATLFNGAAGMEIESYVIYPLFSKWGAMNLGPAAGGVKLFYAESLSGVINWSIAAPLFSLNLVVLTALIQRSTEPLRTLFTRSGLAAMVEQAFRVQRWGLWMAPIIYSFLRMAPDPTWYNQDGAVRTAVATVKNLSAPPEAFHAWSLQTFTNLLAYDWLRIAIFLDHMGLRVATLVNVSFVGMDVIDEKTSRFLGHSVKARAIPAGLRRFVTWAPLLIPFYLPRGADWSHAWNTAEAMAAARPQELLPPELMAGGFMALALSAGLVVLARRLRSSGRAGPAAGCACSQAAACACSTAAESREDRPPRPDPDPGPWVIGNGLYTLSLAADGRGWSRVFSAVRRGQEIDLTERFHDPLEVHGKFFYLVDLDRAADDPQRVGSVTAQPAGGALAEGDCRARRVDRSTLRFERVWNGIRVEASVRVDPRDPLEIWTLRLVPVDARPRRIEVVSYREIALNVPDACLRRPDYNRIHVGTWFVRGLSGILARNRLLKEEAADPAKRSMSAEVAFHAVGPLRDGAARLIGYEDSRTHFIGSSTLRRPEGLERKPREPADEGLLYGFDPIASLRVSVELAPGRAAELVFADGYASSEQEAARFLHAHLGIPAVDRAALDASWAKRRRLHGFGAPGEGDDSGSRLSGLRPCYKFSQDGLELTMGRDTPRPWAHVMANELGYGMVVNNEGAIFSFMGNAQQNGITPFASSEAPAQVPGQVLYLCDTSTGEATAPTFLPFRRKDGACSATFGRGYAVFRKSAGAVDLEYTLCVLADAPAEVRLLTIRNRSSQPAVYRVVPYLQIVLGETPFDTRGAIRFHRDEESGALCFTNPRNDFCGGWAFVAMDLAADAYETVRSRFLGGPEGGLETPFMVRHGRPDVEQPDDGYRVAALAGTLCVAPGGQQTVTLVVGQAPDMEGARSIIRACRSAPAARAALEKTRRWWDERLSVLRVTTRDERFDRLVNDWLPYQVLASHLWGRTGPNQRSGAYGFRDQLQSVLPLLFLDPGTARSQILLHGSQQFFRGDVLQWWHPSREGASGLGARNRASDPHLWLPYVTCRYVEATGDLAILDEPLPYLESRPIPPGHEGLMFAPRRARDREPLYRHCTRAIELTLDRLGRNGLPLIGTGDWNDGLNLVGPGGRGESVWLGFFLYDILQHFAPLAARREGAEQERRYLETAARLRGALDRMWGDGRYARAVTDRGQELVCADALTAAWPAISGAAGLERAANALEQGLEDLETEGLFALLQPPFTEASRPRPGRIADYPPGVRENGGQYSHGVSWLVDALVRLAECARAAGDAERAERFRARAVQVWTKISPAGHAGRKAILRYGLPPHQQAADIYWGCGYEGRGGWSWYTGAAARMLSAAYGLLGLAMRDGSLVVPDDLFDAKGPLQVKRLVYKGEEYRQRIEGSLSRRGTGTGGGPPAALDLRPVPADPEP